MKKRIFLGMAMAAAMTFYAMMALAQGMAINSTGASAANTAILDLSSSTQGLLVPRMTLSQRTAISAPATGLLVYQTNGTAGFYYYSGAAWANLSAAPQPRAQVFTSSGTFTTPSTTSTSTVFKITVTGGGGGGGAAGGGPSAGGGGGAGSTTIQYVSGLTPGSATSVTVGSGGAGSTTNGGTGGTSSIYSIVAYGGGGGYTGPGYPTLGIGGSGGGPGTGGIIAISGGDGHLGMASGIFFGGHGGASFWGDGGEYGTVGKAYGSGGGGHTGGTGAAGKAGVVMIEWVE